ncbi:ATP-binding cassette domain-containing protein [Paenibacillus sp. 19GGS1-52]|uniref:ATP-binding cassette domain-containing protein n=1 Tax=Paenibacillus sp. 19GGS1-52 TaxID=2758563 RepID=UPI001EFA6A55|nr:ATP-binding cassette domain-containing protein [Paenibacillus sp. 19GGS1-52]ULO04869.1 ATP-binding cassette domain-containing protein [Paenibacillus sp. 19GGS1-52]
MKIISAIDLEDVSVTCKPLMFNFESRKDKLEHFSYQFMPGKTYAIVSDPGKGGSALSYLMSGRANRYYGKISIDGNKIDNIQMGSYGWYIGDEVHSNASLFKKSMTVREQLEMGTSELHTVDKLIETFELAPSRLDRSMKHISNERWNASVAIGLAHEKQVFCFPWLDDMWKNAIIARLTLCSTILKQNDCILLIPVHNICNIENFIDDIVYLKG